MSKEIALIKIDERHRIIIPKKIRRILNIKAATYLLISSYNDDGILLRKADEIVKNLQLSGNKMTPEPKAHDRIKFTEYRTITTLTEENKRVKVRVPIFENNGNEMVFFKDLVKAEKELTRNGDNSQRNLL